ncbi:MAG: TnsA-like heteromeric transposase endonuclease subunit [Mycobacterium sp.]|nr:TnsA-like heteromeric transposase endonuclease subunit [Mycobacterium sp.]
MSVVRETVTACRKTGGGDYAGRRKRTTAQKPDRHDASPGAVAGRQRCGQLSLTGELVGLAVEAASPIRRFYSWKRKRNYEGRWWCLTSGGHVEFESLLERDALMMADFDVDAVGIAAQHLAFLWPRQIKGSTYRVPDFFVRLSGGNGRIVDVKRPSAVGTSQNQFELTRAACNEISWQYEVFTGIQPILGKNVAGYPATARISTHLATILRRPSSMSSQNPRRSVSASNARRGNA